MTTTDLNFGRWLKDARKAGGVSQAGLAEELRAQGFSNFHQQTVAKIEAGQRKASVGEAFALSGVLGVTLPAPSQNRNQAEAKAA